MERLTIHRALAELKVLDSRIDRAIDYGTFIVANKASNTKINGMTIEDTKKKIQADFDKVEGLIKRRNEIKSKVVLSNAGIRDGAEVVRVEIAGKQMTVAEAIERKSSIEYEKGFLRNLNSQYRNAVGRVNKENEAMPRKLEVYLQSVLGNKNEAKPEEVEMHTKSFEERNKFELIDPLNLFAKITAMQDEIEAFEMEVDSRLSEENATTFIELA